MNSEVQTAQKTATASVSESRVREVVETAVARCGARREDLVSILTEINHAFGYIPPQAFSEVSRVLHAPIGQLFSVASFYQMLSTKPRGRHLIQFCESAPCHVVGGGAVWKALQDAVHLESGETSSDSKWTLRTTSCLGVCAVGPVITVDEDIYGNLTPKQVNEILERYE